MKSITYSAIRDALGTRRVFAVYTTLRFFILLFLASSFLRLEHGWGKTAIILIFSFTVVLFLHTWFVKKRNWTLLFFPLSFSVLSYALLMLIQHFSPYTVVYGEYLIIPFAVIGIIVAVTALLEKKFKTLRVVTAVLSVLAILTLLFLYFFYNSNPEQYQSCTTDSECVVVQDGCCSCGNSGKETAINSKHQERYEKASRISCAGIFCATMVSNDISCFAGAVCEQGSCTLDTTDASVCAELDKGDMCYYQFALENRDVEYCSYITKRSDSLHGYNSGFSTREQCVYDIATAHDDISYCDSADDDTAAQMCKDKFYMNSTQDQGEEKCETIQTTSFKDDCYKSLASSSKDPVYCEEVQDSKKKGLCVQSFYEKKVDDAQDVETCQEAGDAIGGSIGVETYKNCVETVAINTLDMDVCLQLPHDSEVRKCKRIVATRDADYEYCFENNDDVCARQALGGVAEDEQAIYCPRIAGTEDRSACFEQFITLCKEIEDQSQKDRCIQDVSENFNNDAYCGDIVTDTFYTSQEDCYSGVQPG